MVSDDLNEAQINLPGHMEHQTENLDSTVQQVKIEDTFEPILSEEDNSCDDREVEIQNNHGIAQVETSTGNNGRKDLSKNITVP